MKNKFQELVDRDLSQLNWDMQKQYAVLSAIDKEEPKVKKVTFRTILIAALMAAMMMTVAYAVIAPRMQMDTKVHKNGLALTRDGTEIFFKPLTDEYVAFQSYRPMWIPDGYELTYVSETQYGVQLLIYRNDVQDTALSLYVVRSNAGTHRNGQSIIISEITDEKTVSVGKSEALLYTTPDNGHYLAWGDQEAGYGFFISAADPSIDVLRIAESVAQDPDLIPTEHDYELAHQLLGDYRLTALPDGYSEAERGSWFHESEAKVYIWYLNPETNDVIEFEYTNNGFCEDENSIYEYDDAVPVTIGDMYGIVRNNAVTCYDRNTRLVFTVRANNMDVTNLLQLVESVSRYDAAREAGQATPMPLATPDPAAIMTEEAVDAEQ